MVPYLAAAGHNHYTKSLLLHLDDLAALEETNPEVFKQFVDNGNHVVHRSDKCWAGLSVDLSIEQQLMANFKSAAGHTHGRGVDENQLTTYLLSFPAVGEIKEAMSTLTGVKRKTSSQHDEQGRKRTKRDSIPLFGSEVS